MDELDDKTDPTLVIPVATPKRTVAAIWIVTILLSVYGAAHISDELGKSDRLSDVPVLSELVTKLEALRDAAGFDAAASALGRIRARINEPYTVLEAEAEAPVVEQPPDAGTGAVEDAGGAPEVVHEVAKRKRRVLVIGASSIQFAVGLEFEKKLPTYEDVKVKRYGQLATGLSRPDFFDWPKKLRSLIKEFKPDLVITNFGGNDAQDIPVEGKKKVKFPSEEWDELYAARVKEMVDIAQGSGADIVMLGMSIMREERFTKKIIHLNSIMKRTVESAGAMFVSTFEKSSTKDGQYRKSVRYGGKRGLMRTSDGVHYSALGAKFLVEQAMREIEQRFVFVHPDKDLGVATRHSFESKSLEKMVSYVDYAPRSAESSSAIIVAPEKEAKWDVWPNHPHRALQAIAQAKGKHLIVVEPEALEAEEELVEDLKTNLNISEVEATVRAGADILDKLTSVLGVSN